MVKMIATGSQLARLAMTVPLKAMMAQAIRRLRRICVVQLTAGSAFYAASSPSTGTVGSSPMMWSAAFGDLRQHYGAGQLGLRIGTRTNCQSFIMDSWQVRRMGITSWIGAIPLAHFE